MNKRRFLLAALDLLGFYFIYTLICVGYFLLEQYPFESLISVLINSLSISAFIAISRVCFRVYANLWRYASTNVYIKLCVSDFIGGVAGIGVANILLGKKVTLFNVSFLMAFILCTLASRFAYRRLCDNRNKGINSQNKIKVAIIGAGHIGMLLAKELTFNVNSKYTPYCFVDSDTRKAGSYVSDIKVYPENDNIINTLKSLPISEIFIALPKCQGEELQKIYDFYSQTNLKIKIYDLPVSLLNDAESEAKLKLREFRIEDLLFRGSVDVDSHALKSYYCDKTVLVTGGGGSIGSEICRQLAKLAPKKLIIVDIYENNAYAIQQELNARYKGKLDFCVEIASVRDVARLDGIFTTYKPEIVFHAAAHKHVPLMEHSACEAVKNNVFGTYNTANIAEKHGVKKFILVSTDKAVNPTNVMGASKRLCEMIVQCRTDSKTTFSAVRFGNVLGSNGSVIPLFKDQIEKGGPVTITDKRIIRYFMTIPEASKLVMYAGATALKNDLYVLDMGKPVKILELAENMIRFSGYTPYKDIDIVEIGLRPGEKLYEELLIKTEKLKKTANKKVFIENDAPLSREEIDDKIAILNNALSEYQQSLDSECIRNAMKRVVPTYLSPEEVNKTALASDEMKLAGVSQK